MKNIKKSIYAIFLTIIILILAGYTDNYYNSQTPVEYIISGLENFNKSPQGVFRKAWRIIKNNYVDDNHNHQDWNKWKNRYDTEIETHEDAKVAIETMLASLDDPYTRFLPKRAFEEQHRNIDSKLQGIGVHITEVDGDVVIVSVIDDTPAQKHELMEKDKILQVDGVSTKGISINDVADMVRGEVGSEVTLTIERDEKVLTKNIIREEIKIKTVRSKMLDNNIAYIRISSFISSDTADEFKKALEQTRKTDGIIVDVRGNYGGLLSNAVYITNMFLKSGNIVSIVYRNGNKDNYEADYSGFITQKPMVILIDEGSASASEIFSGAMKDHNKATLVGEKTFGKGRVQMISRLPDDSGINFTIAKYLTPSGTDIDHKGIEPDYEVEYNKNSFMEEEDIQLDKAIEVLLGKLNKAA